MTGKKLRGAATAHEAIQSGCARTMYLAVAGQLGLFTRFCGREDAGGAYLAGRRRDGILSNPSSCLISLRILSTANTSDTFVSRREPCLALRFAELPIFERRAHVLRPACLVAFTATTQ